MEEAERSRKIDTLVRVARARISPASDKIIEAMRCLGADNDEWRGLALEAAAELSAGSALLRTLAGDAT